MFFNGWLAPTTRVRDCDFHFRRVAREEVGQLGRDAGKKKRGGTAGTNASLDEGKDVAFPFVYSGLSGKAVHSKPRTDLGVNSAGSALRANYSSEQNNRFGKCFCCYMSFVSCFPYSQRGRRFYPS